MARRMDMKKPFTDDDIVRFIFDEMEPTEASAFLDALIADEDLMRRYESMQDTVEYISPLQLEPSAAVCANIMEVARNTPPVSKLQVFRAAVEDRLQSVVNLNAVVAIAMFAFLAIGIAGSTIRMERNGIGDPAAGSFGEQVPPTQQMEIPAWEDEDIQQQLEDIRKGIEDIKDDELL